METAQNDIEQHLVISGPSILLASSRSLGWKGIVVEHHIAKPGERKVTSLPHKIVELASGRQVARGERTNWRGEYQSYLKPPGMINLFADGYRPGIRPATETDIIGCMLDSAYVNKVEAEQEEYSSRKLRSRTGFYDKDAASLIRLLAREAEAGGPSGRLYGDHLIYALTLRLLYLSNKKKECGDVPQSVFRNRQLSRVLERMEADFCTDLDLETLAKESGYSRNHFLRLFRASTGYSPHKYLIQLRLEKAKLMMKNKSRHLIDIALSCGFSSDAQLSRAFQRMFQISASQYRRDFC
jgi:AraC family transcriptional regulator